MVDIAPDLIRGVVFGPFSIYNVMYKGAPVRDVLLQAGVNLDEVKDKFLTCTGGDEDFPGDPIQISVPLSYILDPRNEVILAY